MGVGHAFGRPDSWTTDASLFAPQFEAGSVVHLMPEDDSHA